MTSLLIEYNGSMFPETGRHDLVNWALPFLEEKGHVVGKRPFVEKGAVKTDIDGTPRTPIEAIRIAACYPEWDVRKRGHLEYLRSLQSQNSQ